MFYEGHGNWIEKKPRVYKKGVKHDKKFAGAEPGRG